MRVWIALLLIATAAPPVWGQSGAGLDVPHAPTIPRVPPRRTNVVQLVDENISVAPIDGVSSDAVGLFPPDNIGITRDFWGDTPSDVLIPLISRFDPNAMGTVKALRMRIYLTELNPPRGSNDWSVFAARLRYLIAAGALEQAEALLNSANVEEPELTALWFDVGLLAQRVEKVCQLALHNTRLSPSLAHRVFCLARDNRWFDAALTLRVGETVGTISQLDADLLTLFLDPDLFDEMPDPLTPEQLTPLRFVIHEAMGLPRLPGALPLGYLHADLQNRVGWRDRLEGTERLVRSQAFGPGMLDFVYTEAKPAASGGVWDRVAAYQDLMTAFQEQDSRQIGAALKRAVGVFSQVRLLYALAKQIEPQLNNARLDHPESELAFMMLALAADGNPNVRLPKSASPERVFMRDILTDPARAVPTSPMQVAIKTALTGAGETALPTRFATANHTGEAVLRALELLGMGGATNPAVVQDALSQLVAAGLTRDARAIAIEILVDSHVSA